MEVNGTIIFLPHKNLSFLYLFTNLKSFMMTFHLLKLFPPMYIVILLVTLLPIWTIDYSIILYCCITNYYMFSGLKQEAFIIS